MLVDVLIDGWLLHDERGWRWKLLVPAAKLKHRAHEDHDIQLHRAVDGVPTGVVGVQYQVAQAQCPEAVCAGVGVSERDEFIQGTRKLYSDADLCGVTDEDLLILFNEVDTASQVAQQSAETACAGIQVVHFRTPCTRGTIVGCYWY